MSTGTLTVLFEDPFWIGLFEQTDHEGLHVCKVTFGAEPTEKEVMEFIDKNWHRLQFSQAVDVAPTTEICGKPRRKRNIKDIENKNEKDSSFVFCIGCDIVQGARANKRQYQPIKLWCMHHAK